MTNLAVRPDRVSTASRGPPSRHAPPDERQPRVVQVRARVLFPPAHGRYAISHARPRLRVQHPIALRILSVPRFWVAAHTANAAEGPHIRRTPIRGRRQRDHLA